MDRGDMQHSGTGGVFDPGRAPPAPPALQRARGVGRITTKARSGRTVIDRLYQEGCAKIRLPHTHEASLEAVLINTAGGLCGGDDVRWQADAATAGTRLVLTTQACERVYRTTGDAADLATEISVGDGARVDWLPQETILFENSRLRRRLTVTLAPGAAFLGLEAVLLGRSAMGETARRATLADSWRISRAGKLIHAEETRLGGSDLERDGRALLAGANAFATLLYVGDDAERRLDGVRLVLCGRAGVSVIGEKLLVRAVAGSGMMLRRLLVPALEALAGAGALPRLWLM
jgi:urease accessory protein